MKIIYVRIMNLPRTLLVLKRTYFSWYQWKDKMSMGKVVLRKFSNNKTEHKNMDNHLNSHFCFVLKHNFKQRLVFVTQNDKYPGKIIFNSTTFNKLHLWFFYFFIVTTKNVIILCGTLYAEYNLE